MNPIKWTGRVLEFAPPSVSIPVRTPRGERKAPHDFRFPHIEGKRLLPGVDGDPVAFTDDGDRPSRRAGEQAAAMLQLRALHASLISRITSSINSCTVLTRSITPDAIECTTCTLPPPNSGYSHGT